MGWAVCFTMKDVRALNESSGYKFFSPGASRFFGAGYQRNNPYQGFVFVTSEQNGYSNPRRWTVRAIREDGRIKTLGEFGEYTSAAAAHAAAKRLASELRD